jgi:transposase
LGVKVGAENSEKQISELRRDIAKQKRWIEQRDRRIESLEREIERLRQENEKLQRAAKRQAAPFSRGEPKSNPKRRGRKRGKRYGERAFRPKPKHVDRTVDVPAPLYCPDCHKPTVLECTERQWQIDIPPIQPVTTEFRIDVARCTECGRTIRARHPEQVSEATHAAGVQIGPSLIALAATLNKECGMSYVRMARLFSMVFGVTVAPSTLNRALTRLAKVIKPLAEKIGRRVRSGPMLSPDETGWKIGGHKAWLHVAATREDSYYMITRGRGTREATALIGIDYEGTIVRDGLASYRVFTKASAQTCLAHLLRRIDGLLQSESDSARQKWLLDGKRVLQRSIKIRDRRDHAAVGPRGLMISIGQVEAEMDRLIEAAPEGEAVQRFVHHLKRERQALFTFLHRDAVPATNFLAEQALRPAVVNRKMSGGGNNTPTGAASQAALMTVLHSARKRLRNGLTLLVDAMRNPASVEHLL